MEKILFAATVDNHIRSFHLPYLKWFKEQGYEVHVASNGGSDIPYTDKKFEIPFERSPFKLANINAYKQLRRLIDNNDYKLIHCHTPMGGAITRLAARQARKKGTIVFYTAHGFHFYKGASLINWILYYTTEKYLASKYTDVLITINKEDYQRATKFNVFSVLVPGVGVNVDKFSPEPKEDKRQLRLKYNYREEDFILFYAAELNHNKHQDLLINAVGLLKDKIPKIKLLLGGSGDLEAHYKKQVEELELKEYIEFLGFRNDIPNLLKISDVAVSSSRREGLPVNVMEAMATGLPLVVTNSRGNRDLVTNSENGYVIELDDVEGFANAIGLVHESEELRNKFAEKNLERIKLYSLDQAVRVMEAIYSKYL